MFIILFLLVEIRNIQNKSVSSPFNWVSRYILFLAILKGGGRPFLEGARSGTTLWDYSQEHLVIIRDEKVSRFVKLKIILSHLCFLFDSRTNKHCRTNNYWELSKENIFRNMMLSHWPCFTWKFFMIWFPKILNLFFQKQKYLYSTLKKST